MGTLYMWQLTQILYLFIFILFIYILGKEFSPPPYPSLTQHLHIAGTLAATTHCRRPIEKFRPLLLSFLFIRRQVFTQILLPIKLLSHPSNLISIPEQIQSVERDAEREANRHQNHCLVAEVAAILGKRDKCAS